MDKRIWVVGSVWLVITTIAIYCTRALNYTPENKSMKIVNRFSSEYFRSYSTNVGQRIRVIVIQDIAENPYEHEKVQVFLYPIGDTNFPITIDGNGVR